MNIIRQFASELVWAAILSPMAFGQLPDDPVKYNEWERNMLSAIDACGHLSPSESIPKLTRWLGQLKNPGNLAKERREDQPVFRAIQQALLSIPGYERLLTDPVKREWERVMATTDPIDRNGLVHHKLYPTLGAFSALSHLPAPASVRAMGDFLFDDRGRFVPDPNRPLDDEALRGAEEAHPVVCDYAAGTLHMLPIVSKPVPADRRLTADDLPAYRRWYTEIAEGRRTFRFEGDPTEYDLDGPASAEKLARIKALREREHDRKERDDRRMAGTAAPTGPGSVPDQPAATATRPPLAAFLTAAGVLLAALAWYLLRRKARTTRQ